jgi:hypothetical protein
MQDSLHIAPKSPFEEVFIFPPPHFQHVEIGICSRLASKQGDPPADPPPNPLGGLTLRFAHLNFN